VVTPLVSVAPQVIKRRKLIGANQEMLKRKRVESKIRMRGTERVERIEKSDERRLESLRVGQWIEGKVTRLVDYGAWVDVGAQTDGFLHVRAIKADAFVRHPADELQVGQELKLCVKHVDREKHSLGLSCIEVDATPLVWAHGSALAMPMAELEEDQQLWGVVRRVTHFGAFLDCGLDQEAFFHVSDSPARLLGQWAPEVFSPGQRVRAYVKEVDQETRRVKVTGMRPKSLPRVPF
jgi:small subunit ribosomal protein S1